MRKFLSIIAIFLIMLMLVACNVNTSPVSSTTSSSIVTTSASVSSSSVITPQVTAISISSSSSLTQFIGLTSKVTVVAQVTGTNTDGIKIDWYENGVISQSQTGRIFEYFPTSVRTHTIQARFGTVSSNIIQISVDNPSFTVASVRSTQNNIIEVIGEPGLNFEVPGVTISSSSNYNIINNTYTLNLLTNLIQGTTYNITITKSGFKPLVFPLLFDTRKLEVLSFTYDTRRVTANTDGVYSVVKPFNSGTTNTYSIVLNHTNLEGSGIPFSLITNAPAGATVPADQQAINLAKGGSITRSFNITNESPIGLYVHNYSVNGKTITVRVMVTEPSAFVDIDPDAPVVYGPAGSQNLNGTYNYNSSIFSKTNEKFDYLVTPNAAGTYVVFKPYNGPAKQLSFKLEGDYFLVPTGFPAQGNPHQLLAVLTGPVGGSMLYGNNIPNTLTSFLQYRSTFSDFLINHYIDNKTAVGVYTFTFSAGTFTTTAINKTIRIEVREYQPEIEPLITYGGAALSANPDGSYTIDKPISGNTLTSVVNLNVKYYESPLQYLGGTGMDTLYDPDTAVSGDIPKYLLNLSITYSGPLTGIANVNKKVAIELGSSSTNDTVVALGTSTEYNRYFGAGDSALVNVTTDLTLMGVINATTFPGTHVYTIRLGNLTRVLTIRIQEPSPKIVLGAQSIKYGGANAGSTLASNVTKGTDGKYYVNGPDQWLVLNVLPGGMNAGNYPYIFSRTSPSGAFLSNTNFVNLALVTPYNGNLEFPVSGPGSEMIISELLTEEGEYKFNYNINGATLNISIVVLPYPQLRVDTLKLLETDLVSFNQEFYIVRSQADRFLTLILNPINIESNFKFTVSTIAIDANDNSSKRDIILSEGKLNVEITLPGSDSTDFEAREINTVNYYVRLYNGSTLVGAVTIVRVNVQNVKD
jgi:hypothetical protein